MFAQPLFSEEFFNFIIGSKILALLNFIVLENFVESMDDYVLISAFM